MDFLLAQLLIVFKAIPSLILGALIWVGIAVAVNLWQAIRNKIKNNHK